MDKILVRSRVQSYDGKRPKRCLKCRFLFRRVVYADGGEGLKREFLAYRLGDKRRGWGG